MVADWYCVIDNRQFGPITAVQLKQLATTGKLQPSHLVWKEGMQNRVPAQSVKGLFDAGSAGVFEQQMIQLGALHLNGIGRAIEFAFAENKTGGN